MNERFYLSLSKISIFPNFLLRGVFPEGKGCVKNDFQFQGFPENSLQFSRKNDLKERQCRINRFSNYMFYNSPRYPLKVHVYIHCKL